LCVKHPEVELMRRVVVGVVLVLALAAGAVALIPDVRAQERFPGDLDVMLLEGPGASIGVTIRDLNANEAEKAKLPQPGGVLVTSVTSGGPGSRAGLRTGDIVTEFDGDRVRSARQFSRLVRETPPGRVVKSSILRDGSSRTIDVAPEAGTGRDDLLRLGDEMARRLEALPRNFSLEIDPRSGLFRRSGRGRLGLELLPLGDQLASHFGVRQGVLVSSVDAESSAASAGLKAGDVITAIDGRPVETVADVSERVRQSPTGSVLELTIMRDKKESTLEVRVPEPSRPQPNRSDRAREI
jgi:serine protease Do